MTSVPETGGLSSRPPGAMVPRAWASNWTRTWSAGPPKAPAGPASRAVRYDFSLNPLASHGRARISITVDDMAMKP